MSCPSFPGCALAPVELPSLAGTAPREDAYCLVELAKPWPAKVKKVEGLIQSLREVLKKNKGEEARLLATPEIPWEGDFEGPRALLLRWDGSQTLCQELPASPEALKEALSRPPQGTPKELYLVCTHGSRDPCCGLLGVPIFLQLQELTERSVLQVSHIGGHRFAPVVAAFPEWRFYGHIQAEQLPSLDQALADKEPYLEGYRGLGRLKTDLQTIEAFLWQRYGSKLGAIRKISGDKTELLIEALIDGQATRFSARLSTLRYEGYKSCKDFRKEKCSTLKIPVLESLTPAAEASEPETSASGIAP